MDCAPSQDLVTFLNLPDNSHVKIMAVNLGKDTWISIYCVWDGRKIRQYIAM